MFSIYDVNSAHIAQRSPLYAQFVAAHYAAGRMGALEARQYILNAAVLAGQGDILGARANMAQARAIVREYRLGHLISCALTGKTMADVDALDVAL